MITIIVTLLLGLAVTRLIDSALGVNTLLGESSFKYNVHTLIWLIWGIFLGYSVTKEKYRKKEDD